MSWPSHVFFKTLFVCKTCKKIKFLLHRSLWSVICYIVGITTHSGWKKYFWKTAFKANCTNNDKHFNTLLHSHHHIHNIWFMFHLSITDTFFIINKETFFCNDLHVLCNDLHIHCICELYFRNKQIYNLVQQHDHARNIPVDWW